MSANRICLLMFGLALLGVPFGCAPAYHAYPCGCVPLSYCPEPALPHTNYCCCPTPCAASPQGERSDASFATQNSVSGLTAR